MKLLAQVLKEAMAIREASWDDANHSYKLYDSTAIKTAIDRLGYDARYQFPAECMFRYWNDSIDWIDSILGTHGGA